MRNPIRPALNFFVALAATVALAPLVFAPSPAYARGGGGGGGKSNGSSGRGSNGGSNPGSGGGRGSPGAPGGTGGGNKGGTGGHGNTASKGANGQVKNPTEYLVLIQQDDSDDHRSDFLFDARSDGTVDARDKDRAAALAANRENSSRLLRADDMPRP